MLKKIGDSILIEVDEIIGVHKTEKFSSARYVIYIDYRNGTRYSLETDFKDNWNKMFKQICDLIEARGE